jgi:hypothetical protein
VPRLPVSIDGALKRVGRFEYLTTHRRLEFQVFAATSRAQRGVWRAMDGLGDLPMGNAQRRVVREFGAAVETSSVVGRKRQRVTPTAV